ncbi:MAG: flagellar basal body L-ring protein FlgH [Deltaproteobacteria bacterium]|nr:flagellar basal body L-ring protein FlgH [Deltaproteobacteria bacterium]
MPAGISAQKTPGSIWPGPNAMNRYFSDFRARDVGDVITVIIAEKASASEEASTATSRASGTDAAVTDLLGLPLDLGMSNFLGLKNKFSPTVKSDYASNFDGQGSTKRAGEITTTISVRVTEVLPNGNLFIEGRKDTQVNNDERFVVLSGIVRPEDISASNVVYSDMVSDLRVELSGYGEIASRQKSGWLARILDEFWPF